MTETTDIKALREASLRDMFENGVTRQEQCSLGFVMSLRNEAGCYSNEKIDDMWLGFKLAVAPEGGRTVGEVAMESNHLFDKNKLLIDQLEAERQRADDLQSEQNQHDTQIAEMEGKIQLITRGFRLKTERCEKAEKELAALRSNHAIECQNAVRIALQASLRGEQEPVGIFAGTDEYSEARHISWLSGASKLQLGDKLFTSQPKPVVVLPKEFFTAKQNMRGMFELSEDCMCGITASMEAAGIVVKEGE